MDSAPPPPRTWTNIRFLLGLAWNLDPRRVLLQFFSNALGYATWIFFGVFFLRILLNAITAQTPAPVILAWIGVSVAVLGLLTGASVWFLTAYQPRSDLRMNAALARKLFAQAVRVDLACYEDEAFYNRFTLALKEAEARLPEFLRDLTNGTVAAVAAVVILVTLGQIDPWLLAFLLFPLVGNFVFGRWASRLRFRRDNDLAGPRRRVNYVNRVLYLPEYAKEIRLSRVLDLLLDHLDEGYGGLFAVIGRYRGRAVGASFLFQAFTFLLAFQGALLYGAWLAIEKKSIDLGTFAVLASATVSASWMLINVSENLVSLWKQTFSIENLRQFLAQNPTIDSPAGAPDAPRPFEGLEFRHVSFTYPGQSEPTLRDLDFRLRPGETMAVVGHNGAGKSTLVKLILRLYEPTEGQILYNGRPLGEWSLASYRRLFGTAFQDFRVFALTVAENVLSRPPEGPEDRHRVQRALEQAGVWSKVASLAHGMDTVLTREFDDEGANLSGGELQKIALARALASDPEIALLDEPSSALDPVSEYQLYETIQEVWGHRAVVFISHRLSSATLADRILLMEGGRIAEEGSHPELLARNGAYAGLFRLQAEHYLEDNFATLAEEATP